MNQTAAGLTSPHIEEDHIHQTAAGSDITHIEKDHINQTAAGLTSLI